MNEIIIFGIGKISEVVYYCFKNHSNYKVVAFTADKQFITNEKYFDLPVLPFEEIENYYSPGKYAMFIALGYQNLNELRTRKLFEAKEKGYKIVSFIHPQAGLPDDTKIGENCFIMQNVHIHPIVSIGDNVFMWSGTIICHHSIINNNCWFASGASIAGNVSIGENCFFGINATVGHSAKIGDRCFLGANSLAVRDIENDVVLIEPETKKYSLNSAQFIKMTDFDNV